MGRLGCPTNGGNWVRSFLAGSPCKPKNVEFPLLLDITPTQKSSPPIPFLMTDHILKKKKKLPKILPVTCTFSHKVLTYLKNLGGTKFLNTKQYPAGLSPRIMPQVSPFLQKISPPLMCGLSPFLQTFMGNHGDGWDPTQQPKIFSFPPAEKPPLLYLHLLLSKVPFLPYQIAIFM